MSEVVVNAMSTLLGHTAAYGCLQEQTKLVAKVALSSTDAY
jgi:hypothetical protein